jgi:hypothetical protein
MRLCVFCRKFSRCRAWRRLESSINAYRIDFDGRMRVKGKSEGDLEPVHAALDRAQVALQDGDIDGGWKYLHSGQRLELLLLEAEELAAVAVAMRQEAEKLTGWRRSAIAELLKENPPNAPGVFQAALLRDEQFNNNAYKDGLRRARFWILALAFIVTVGAILWASYTQCFLVAARSKLLPQIPSSNWQIPIDIEIKLLFSVALVGLLGAIVSAATGLLRDDTSTRIPELASAIQFLLLRLLIGPASAIIIYLAVRSALYGEIIAAAVPDGFTMLLIAFVAGFTERLVLRVVEAIAGK